MASARPSWRARKHRWSEEDPGFQSSLVSHPPLTAGMGVMQQTQHQPSLLLQESHEAAGIWLSWLAGAEGRSQGRTWVTQDKV